MKQYIQETQFKELSKQAQERLIDWCVAKHLGDRWYHTGLQEARFSFNCECQYPESDLPYPSLSIGQMIEFLDEHTPINYGAFEHWLNIISRYTIDDDGVHPNYEGELCDVLFTAVKEILEK